MVKHTQTIRRQFADGLFKYVWPFCEIDVKRVNVLSDFLKYLDSNKLISALYQANVVLI